MRYLSSIILFLFACCGTGNAQSSTAENVPDTLTPQTVAVQFYATLDSLPGDTLYVIASPKGFVINSVRDFGSPMIALKTKTGYAVFAACPDESFAWNYSFSSINFDGKGHDELLVRWNGGMGRSGYADGWSEVTGGVYLWDLDNRELIFSMQDKYEYNYWSNGVQYDSLGNLMEDSLGNVIMNDSFAGGESNCENYDVDIAYRKITIARSPDCILMYENTEGKAAEVEEPAVYVWTKQKRGK